MRAILRNPLIAVLIVIFLSSAGLIANSIKAGGPSEDSLEGYEIYAYVLSQTGVYSRQIKFTLTPEPAVGRAPFYPAFLSLFFITDTGYREYFACKFIARKSACGDPPVSVHVVQSILFIIAGLLIFATARIIGAGPISSVLFATLTILLTAEYAVHYRLSESVVIPLCALFGWLMARLYFQSERHLGTWEPILLGLVLGVLALSRFAYFYLAPIFVLVIFLICPGALKTNVMARTKSACLILLSAALIVGPWLYRNYQITGKPEVGSSGVARVLADRLFTNRMNMTEALAGITYRIPYLGNNLTKALFPENVWSLYDESHQNSSLQQSRKYLRDLRRQGLNKDAIAGRLKAEILQNPIRHSLVSFIVGWRGLKFTFPILPFFLVFLWVAIKNRHWTAIAVVAPGIIYFAFHAVATQFHERYGYPMLISWAPAAALAASWLWQTKGKITSLKLLHMTPTDPDGR